MESNKPEDKIIKSIITPDLMNVSQEILELGVHEIIGNQLVNKLPIISLIVTGYKTTISIRDYLYIKKIAKFLFEQSKTTNEERELWFKNYKKENNRKIGEITLELIDKVNSLKKAQILGILFRNQIQGKITSQEFIRFGEMINSVYLDDIDYFLNHNEQDLGEIGDEVDHLLSTGFLYRGGGGFGNTYLPYKKPQHSSYGKTIFDILKKEL